MTKFLRPSLLASILAGVVCGIGCNPLMLPAFLGPEPMVPPELHALKVADKKGPVKVVILVDKGNDFREEFTRADGQLGDLLRKQMKEMAEAGGEKLEFISLRKVMDYTNTHPNWREDVAEIGRDLKADYVIYLEIASLTLYEKGSRDLYRGDAKIAVSLHRIGGSEDDDEVQRKQYHGVYPSVRTGIPVDIDTTPTDFREQFLGYVAKRIAWYFIGHPSNDKYMDDSPRE